MTYLPHQLLASEEATKLLGTLGYVYIAGKPRSGKTLTSIKVAENTTTKGNWLILTTKNAITGWDKFLNNKNLVREYTNKYTVTNYEQLGKLTVNSKGKKVVTFKYDSTKYDGIILDEAHNYGVLGKPTSRALILKVFSKEIKYMIYLSGTAIVESACGIYHQTWYGKTNPYSNFKKFYDFHRVYGIPCILPLGGRSIQQYHKFKPELVDSINNFTIYMTQEDAGISKELQAVDKVHYIDLTTDTKTLYNKVVKEKLVTINGIDIVCDSTMKLRTTLHMIEGGTVKQEDTYITLGNTEKIEYIKNTFDLTKNTGIMCHFIQERKLLAEKLPMCIIYSSTSHSEGVDLSHLDNFIIYSSDYRGSKFIQRRDRIVNINGSKSLVVHHLLVKDSISEQVYNKVSKKLDFNNATYISKYLI